MNGVTVYRGGREVCDLKTAAGQREYESRIRQMLEWQKGICCLFARLNCCPGPLLLDDAVFEHEDGRGMGGGRRDDRVLVDGKRKNGAACWMGGDLTA